MFTNMSITLPCSNFPFHNRIWSQMQKQILAQISKEQYPIHGIAKALATYACTFLEKLSSCLNLSKILLYQSSNDTSTHLWNFQWVLGWTQLPYKCCFNNGDTGKCQLDSKVKDFYWTHGLFTSPTEPTGACKTTSKVPRCDAEAVNYMNIHQPFTHLHITWDLSNLWIKD